MYDLNLTGEFILNQYSVFPGLSLQANNEKESQNVENDEQIQNWVIRSQNGEREPFELLYKEFINSIYRYIYLRVGKVETAEDITQEVFLKAWNNIGSYRFQGKPFASWLFRIAHNLIIDYYRQNDQTISIPLMDTIVDVGKEDPAGAAEQNQEISRVNKAIEDLPPKQKEVLSLRFGTELTIAETAQITGISEGSVKKLQHEAISKLRKRLDQNISEKNIKIKGLFLDYDGTISPLNVSRENSRVSPHLETLLNKIRKLVPISIITTKDLPFILPRTTFADAWGAIAGLEIKSHSELYVPETLKRDLPSLKKALEFAKNNISFESLIEEKCDSTGQPLAFCVDWRQSRDKRESKRIAKIIMEYCKELHLKVVKYPGKPYFDVFSCQINKGKALKKIKNYLNLSGNILYMGDSATDNPAFKEADISIGVTRGKKPVDLNCQYWIDFQDVPKFLNHLFENNFTFHTDLPSIQTLD